MKQLPYGISDFKLIRRDNMYYVDKTPYLQKMEEENNYLFLIRPRRFGKSLFISMIESYYDVEMKDRFQSLFGGLYVGSHPTPKANFYLVLKFDFSRVKGSIDVLEANFNEYCCGVMDYFITKYKKYFDEFTYTKVLNAKSAEHKLNLLSIAAQHKEVPIYLIIDEYDNFTNDVLAHHGKEAFQKLTHAEGFYRGFFKLFKGAFERIFMTGISPVTLDDLTSGFNIDWNISNLARFNSILGFEESDVRAMLEYYSRHSKVPNDTEAIIKDMRPWYDNYCFALRSYGRETVYNCDMALYYLQPLIKTGLPPEDMIDKNIRMDYSKLQSLIELDRGVQREWRESVIEQIANTGYIDMTLATSFPAMELLKMDNFRSLIYYYGMITIGGENRGLYHMVIPNECVRQQYWRFLVEMYQRVHRMDTDSLTCDFQNMIFDGDWEPTIKKIGEFYRELSSSRDARGGEFNVQGFFKAMLGICNLSLLCPEMELNYGYCDFLMVPLRNRHPEAKHAYLFEIKYVKSKAPESDEKQAYADAKKQIEQYAASPKLGNALSGCSLHCITVLFRGENMQPPRIILEKHFPE
ncbi:MAG: ATP-binding protein [Bacteroidales bacterium]|nr:ATP-binding protein [Bacteroidales bacterium]